jgi:DNA-binding GntR family transcriptional regulator
LSIPTTGIDRSSAVPLHDQFRAYVLDLIANGELQPGQRLPGEREYAASLGISLAPIRQALLDLVKQGYLTRARGRGTFVEEPPLEKKVDILSSFTQSMRAAGLEPEIQLVFRGLSPAPTEARSALRTRQRELLVIRRVAVLDGTPIALLVAYLSPTVLRKMLGEPLHNGSLYQTLHDLYGITPSRAVNTIEVIRCQDEAVDLRVPKGTPALQVSGATFDQDGQPFEFSRVTYRAERFRFSLESFRERDRVVHLLSDPEHRRQRTAAHA